ncbi:hypothetical protein MRB53_022860 [Persea americana]|uniref:Uncharacterized protein n=1 Tax=Persea americana TaxID=3435 RepID=A0ACC2L8U6_PERAE|nr:hypothetical protein MRB53_022860 [Persea americana]
MTIPTAVDGFGGVPELRGDASVPGPDTVFTGVIDGITGPIARANPATASAAAEETVAVCNPPSIQPQQPSLLTVSTTLPGTSMTNAYVP